MKQVLQRLVVRLLVASVLAGSASAQPFPSLAITEVMTKASLDQYPPFRGTDFLELTNFGTNEVNLTGYGLSDDNTNVIIKDVFTNVVIHAGETIVFVNTAPSSNVLCQCTNYYQLIPDASAFRKWWGASNLPENLQIRTYSGPRFSGSGDEAWLYNATGKVVDKVSVGVAVPGRSFGYDPITGVFGKIGLPGEDGIFKAASTDDYGSPGRVSGPVPLRILQQPVSQTAEVDLDVTLTVAAGGMPPPKYQWTFQGTPLTNATAASLTLSNVQPTDAGDYQVIISNGSTQLFSAVASLTVNTNPYVKILRPPSNLAAYEGQTARFSVLAWGIPLPSYQWHANGVDIPGEINPFLDVLNCTSEMSGTVYGVRVWNQDCSTNAAARLVVTSRPQLAFTEQMSCTSNGHEDWFELTNFGTNSVDLQGYRLSDKGPANINGQTKESFADFIERRVVVKITNSLVLKPKESVIFVNRMSADDFVRWWGKGNLPPGLQIRTFSGFSLSSRGESVRLWNAAAQAEVDTVASASWLDSTNACSWVCSDNEFTANGYVGYGDVASVLGLDGAWAASEGGDIGSPGLTAVTPPHFLGISSYLGGVILKCRSNPGQTIRLSLKASLTDSEWLPVSSRVATNSLPFYLFDAGARGNPMRFYRLEEVP